MCTGSLIPGLIYMVVVLRIICPYHLLYDLWKCPEPRKEVHPMFFLIQPTLFQSG
ncbi:hypothetical protein BDV41DRAFT_520369 [Aspergillus transmontanensis]|uniref:Uncharacterized protein n=1 Tax=Aspergillus transmontanensis TaxID=1034304 RepID=A0A5N6WEQ8_9EURO|nr:hypothetical protein BDV41DRAFT_520369 [Aspergillus transmontanensis]